MNHYKYLIIGGGMSAAAAIDAIREVDSEGTLALISAESHRPYDRPPLSKGLWQDYVIDDIMRDVDEANVQLHLERTVERIDPQQKQVTDDQNNSYSYDKLLLATGGAPRRLPFGDDRIIYYRTLADYKQLRHLVDTHEKFVVIGGGFIGSELAAALAMNDVEVTIIFPEQGICRRLFPAGLSEYLNDYYRQQGVEVLAGEEVKDVRGSGTDLTVVTGSGREISANGVVAGIGIELNTALAEAAGLEVDQGIVVNEKLQTSDPNIFAAGDAVNFHDPLLQQRRHVEHEDNAITMGQVAGRVMAGEDITYEYSPMFYSDMFDLGYEAVGELNSDLETVEDWTEPHKKGVVYYLDQGRVRGVLLWNVWDKLAEARDLMAKEETFGPDDLIGRI